MLPAGPVARAPVSKALFMLIAINSIFATITTSRSRFHLQLLPHILTQHQYWRLVSSHLLFSSSAEILFGSLLIYQFRLLERHWGSPKYTAFILVVSAITTLVNVAGLALSAVLGTGWSRVACGPFGVLVAALCVYAREVPESYRFKVVGIEFSDHVFVNGVAAQLALVSFPGSLLPCVGGLVAASLYMSNTAGLKTWRLPLWLRRSVGGILGPLLDSRAVADNRPVTTNPDDQRADSRARATGRSAMVANVVAELDGARGSARANTQPAAPQLAGMPADETVDMVVGMGFDRDRAILALRQHGNDPNAAVASLLEQ
ncbi:hypothetical protein BC831DRAFT_459256 [Entophlyctis helioformis]|nr:hypothetical protein BC831DRAFT_459256 [Entophlyctis helioformis]